jgi:hypothetical protein
MRLKVIVPGPECRVLELEVTHASEDASPLSGREIPKALINSDEHREWQVYHAQPRFGLKRISRTDHGKPGAAVLELAGFRVRLDARENLQRDRLRHSQPI